MKKKENNQHIQIKNKKATFDYEILQTYVAGMELLGTEIKSIRLGKAGLTDTYCIVDRGEVWVKNMYIAEYSYASYNNHQTRRDRRLLLTKKEIATLEKAYHATGMTVVPLKVFINERGLAKMILGVGKGKKVYDKRQSIKEKEDKRNMDRVMKSSVRR